MAESFIAYIDEAGDDGFKFRHPGNDGGSSRWLVLSAAVFRTKAEAELPKLRREIRGTFDKGRKPPRVMHFRKLTHERRVNLVRTLGRFPMRAVSILIYKPAIQEPVFRRERYLYSYAVRLLLERISWLCAEKNRIGEGDGTVRLRFEHRRSTSYQELRSYLSRLRSKDPEETRIAWEVIDIDKVEAHPKDRYFGLQVADAVAGAFFQELEANRQGWSEGRYCREIKRVVFGRRGNRRSYGAKVWPPEAMAVVENEPHLRWYGECFGR